nr:hypothetical protein CFP56_10044 [Quercus suber]
MFTAEDAARHWKASHFGRSYTSDPLVPKSKPGLAVDTSFARHKGELPQQIFPQKPRKADLTCIGFNDVKKSKEAGKPSFRQQVENIMAIRPAAQKSVSDSTKSKNAESNRRSEVPILAQSQTPNFSAGETKSDAPPVHRRIQGLRPSPLDLAPDVSPSDRAITIGISLPSVVLSTSRKSPRSSPQRLRGQQQSCEAATPTIIITPAKDEFDFDISQEDLRHASGYRPASSVYSRFTNCVPAVDQSDHTPPVPPLPLFVADAGPHEHALSTNDSNPQAYQGQTRNAMLKHKISEEVLSALRYPRTQVIKRTASQATLNTPRQSKGWWNFITSPFSASSRSNGFFWQSPSLREGNEDREPIIHSASEFGRSNVHEGVIFTNRSSSDEALRSAPPTEVKLWNPTLLKRSDTAPGAYCNGQYAVDIYRIPSQGEAAAYYDPNRHFPSLVLSSKDVHYNRDALEGWSPSQSVYRPETKRHSRTRSSADTGRLASEEEQDEKAHDVHHATRDAPHVESSDLVPDTRNVEIEGPPPSIDGRNIFSTPPEEELESPPAATSARQSTHPVVESYFSPISATPVVEDAHKAAIIGPKASYGDLQEVGIPSARTPSRIGPTLAAATMAHRDIDESHAAILEPVRAMSWSEKPTYKPVHSRSSSHGLGISNGEHEFSPPVQTVSKKPTLGIDRFGQLEVRSFDEKKRNSLPWYKRFLWMLIAFGTFMLTLVIVLLVVLIPQSHSDIPVEAQWVNTTAFPPLPTGVTTVINPRSAAAVSGCVDPTALWSCDTPNAQGGLARPNFRFEIRFRSGLFSNNETTFVKRAGNVARAGSVVRRDAWSSSLFASLPSPPSLDDQLFIGQTTDNISSPYDGEQTPFYISLLDPSNLNARSIEKRQNDRNPYPYPTTTASNSSSTATTAHSHTSQNATKSAPTLIPAPVLSSTGEAAAAILYPHVTAQPLRLYNRGADSEHYGFYSYFDRSILVANLSASTIPGLNPNITSGDISADNATAVCTFSQTRLHVQIWTRKSTVTQLGTPIPLRGLDAANSTANDMSAAGSFPYAVTVSLDRHGGAADHKGVYCYGIDGEHYVDVAAATWIAEDRAFQGILTNPADVPGTQTSKRDNDGSVAQGIDGGSGGCECSWQNWS